MEADAPPDVSTELHTLEQETKEEIETPTDFSIRSHCEEEKNKEAKTIVETKPLHQKIMEKIEGPGDASEPHSVELEGKSKAAETSNELQASLKKTRKLLKPRSNFAKKPPASNSLNKKKAKVTVAEHEGEKEIKKKGALIISDGNNSKEEDTAEALCMEQENKEETESAADVSTDPHSVELENENEAAETSNELSAQHNNEGEIQAARDVSTEAPGDASEPHSVELEGKSKAAETSNELQASLKKTRKLLKPRSKFAKTPSVNKKKAKVTVAEHEGEKEIKKKGALIINDGNNSKEEDTAEGLCMEQENKEETESAADVSTDPHHVELENENEVAETSNELSAQHKKKGEIQAARDVSAEAPGDASEPHSVELKGKSKAAKTSNELQASLKNSGEILKPRSKFAKTPPASNSVNNKKAKVTVAEHEGDKELKKKGALIINDGNNSKGEDTAEALCMEQENKGETESAADVSTNPHPVKLENENEVAETSNELSAQHKNEGEIQAARDVSTEPHSMDLKNKSESARTSEKLQAPKKRIVKVLKARSKIAKKSPAIASSMTKNVKMTLPKVEVEKATKEKNVLSVKKGNNGKEDSLKRSTDPRSEEKDDHNLKGKNSCNHVEKNAREIAADSREEKKAVVLGKSKRKWKETVNQKSNKSLNNLNDNEKPDNLEKKPRKEKKEKLGGLIFMCNSKTKPDCLSYGVMGVSVNKKDLVLGVRPGLMLFLYDYDLKLMYGIYKATSPGGMRLEPRAFDGAFPVQVRFEVHLDCYPLPESIFRKGMQENFTTKHKFKTELSNEQVSRLAALFRPIELQLKELPAQSPRLTKSRTGNSHVRARESRHVSRRQTLARDPYADHQSRRLLPKAHGRDQQVRDHELAPRPRAESREMYPTEQQYRAFGLRGDRRNSDLPRHISPTLTPYREDHERERLRRRPEEIHREAPLSPQEYAVGRSYTSDREYRNYSLHPRQELPYQFPPSRAGPSAAAFDSYREDTYDAYRHGAASVDPYAHRSRREDILSGSFYDGSRWGSYSSEKDHPQRRKVNRDESHPRCIDDLMEPDRAHRYGINEKNAASLPVSSRYSFAGPRI